MPVVNSSPVLTIKKASRHCPLYPGWMGGWGGGRAKHFQLRTKTNWRYVRVERCFHRLMYRITYFPILSKIEWSCSIVVHINGERWVIPGDKGMDQLTSQSPCCPSNSRTVFIYDLAWFLPVPVPVPVLMIVLVKQPHYPPGPLCLQEAQRRLFSFFLFFFFWESLAETFFLKRKGEKNQI